MPGSSNPIPQQQHQKTHVGCVNKRGRMAPNSVYTYATKTLSPAAVYANKRKNGIYDMPGWPTVGVPTKASGKCVFVEDSQH